MAPIDTSLRTAATDTQKTDMLQSSSCYFLNKKREIWRTGKEDKHATCMMFLTCALLSTSYLCILTIFFNEEIAFLLAFTKGIPARAECSCVTR